MRLIDADELMLKVDMHGTNQFGMLDEDIRQFINDVPTVDAQPVKHARWVKTGRTNGYGDTEYKCLNCQSVIYVPDDSMIVREKYCFNCGCKMTLKDGESK